MTNRKECVVVIHKSEFGRFEVRDYREWKTCWYLDGTLHREDAPAVEYRDGDKEYWVHGKLHRKDGPAIDYKTKKSYYKEGVLHREDGPAEACTNSLYFNRYFLEGREYPKTAFEIEINKRKKKLENCSGKIVEIDGKKYKLTEVKE